MVVGWCDQLGCELVGWLVGGLVGEGKGATSWFVGLTSQFHVYFSITNKIGDSSSMPHV